MCTENTVGIIGSMKQTIEGLTTTQVALVERLAKKTRSEDRRLVGLHKRQEEQITQLVGMVEQGHCKERGLERVWRAQACEIERLKGLHKSQIAGLERVVEAQAREIARLKNPVIQVRFTQFCETCRAICEEMDFDWYEIVCSAEVGGVKVIEK